MCMSSDVNSLILGNLKVISRPDGTQILTTISDSVNSVLNPSAQSARLCVHGIDFKVVMDELYSCINSMKCISKVDYLIFLIMLETGCRVSEVLNIRKCDVIYGQGLKLSGSKGSSDRVINLNNDVLFSYSKMFGSFDKLFNVSRFYVYRRSIYYGFNELKCGYFVDKPTKMFRYVKASLLAQSNINVEMIADVLGHKRMKNVKYYLHPSLELYKTMNNE